MKRVIVVFALGLLVFPVSAQVKKSTASRNVSTQYVEQPTMWYAGLTFNTFGTLGLSGGGLYALNRNINAPVAPYAGGEVGIAEGWGGLDIGVGVNVGVMLGQPNFRWEFRVQPQLILGGFGEHLEPAVAARVGFWIYHFNFFAQIKYTLEYFDVEYSDLIPGLGISWRF